MSRLRTRTSDFFRGTTSTSTLHLPSGGAVATEQTKSKRRIPFLSRSRKKSSQSERSSTSNLADASGAQPEQALPLLNVSPLSLGSKFAAAFIHSKSRSQNTTPQKPPVQVDEPKPPSPRPRSTSSSSGASDRAASRPAPIITVSVSPPQDLEDESFDDLFTRPIPTRADDKLDTPGPSSPHLLSADLDVESADSSDDIIKTVDLTDRTALDSPSENIEFTSPWATARTLATMPYKPNEQTSYSPKSIMKSSSVARGSPITAPPSIPLPSPPASLSSFPTTMTLQTLPSRKSSSPAQQLDRRPRAHTITSVFPQNLPVASQSPPVSPSAAKKQRTKAYVRLPEVNLDLDLENATLEQLKVALATQRTLYDELFVSISEKHAAEKVALQKRVEILERDARKANRELKGLRYLIMNGTGAGTGSLPDLTVSDVQRSDLGAISTIAHSLMPSSSQTTGGKSVQKDRPSSLNVPSNTKPTMGLGLDFTVPDIPYLSGGHHAFEHRLSVSSFASSAESSTSSLSSDLTPATTALSVIPEASSPPSPVLEPETPHDPVTAAILVDKLKDKEERRASRGVHRISSSSITSSVAPLSASPTTTTYSSSIKRVRPPSIAQVLDDSQNMEEVLEKLRPFGAGPTPPNP